MQSIKNFSNWDVLKWWVCSPYYKTRAFFEALFDKKTRVLNDLLCKSVYRIYLSIYTMRFNLTYTMVFDEDSENDDIEM